MSTNPLKRGVRGALNKLGYDLRRTHPLVYKVGMDPFYDMRRFVQDPRLVVFDVGANIGQSVDRFRSAFPECTIHSFEPSPSTFATLKEQTGTFSDLHLWNCGIGSRSEPMTFIENSQSDMSSFLAPSELSWGTVTKETVVAVRTIDEFCDQEAISRIDILKSDTQGFELEVFRGAEASMRAGRIGLVYFEIIVSDMYKDLPSFSDTFAFLTDCGFHLVSTYDWYYQRDLASWTDALFVHESVLKSRPVVSSRPTRGQSRSGT